MNDFDDDTTRYEARIGPYWYPVKILGARELFPGRPIIDVEVQRFLAWNGIIFQGRPFTDYSTMAGPSDNKYGYVYPQAIRETTDDPLKTVYPKTK